MQHGNVFIYGFSCDIFAFSILNAALIGQNIADAVGRGNAANIGAKEQQDRKSVV